MREHKLMNVRKYVDDIFEKLENADEKRAAYIHSYGVSQCCSILAIKCGLDSELAAAIGLLHDIYSYKTGVTALHSQNGAEMIRVAFKYDLKDLFSDEEQIIIQSAVYHHSSKNLIHDDYDELLKDGDVLQHLSFDKTYRQENSKRLFRILKELSLTNPNPVLLPKAHSAVKPFHQSLAGDIAESLAEKKITGEKSNTEYMRIIRYFPEESAFDELENAWCAAFVYHCCIEAGLSLPIRDPHTADNIANCRFACVLAWYEWGMENGFCYFEKDSFVPVRGDIVIYHNIIPKENKPESSTWCDHIGIVLSCGRDGLITAEGNAGNKNVSDIIFRKRDGTIGCYIRIPKDYVYDGWKTDFKTGREKVITLGGSYCNDR